MTTASLEHSVGASASLIRPERARQRRKSPGRRSRRRRWRGRCRRVTDLPPQPRIPPLPPPDGERPQLNIFRTLGRNRPLYKGFLALGGHLLGPDGALPPREREIVILRAGF